jgi:hypothetical protein
MSGMKRVGRPFEGPSLAEAAQSLRSGNSALGKKGRALASQVERLAKILQRAPSELPADWPMIKIIVDAEIGDGWQALDFSSDDAWDKFKYRAKKGVESAFSSGRHDPLRLRGRRALLPAWQNLMSQLDGAAKTGDCSRFALWTMTGLARMASAKGVEPTCIDAKFFQTWIAEAEAKGKVVARLVRRGRVRGRGRYAYDAARTWNKLVRVGFAKGQLVVLKGLRTGRHCNAPISSFHPELKNEIESYLDWLRGGVAEAARRGQTSDEDSFDGYASSEYTHVRLPKSASAESNGPKPREDKVGEGTIGRYRHLIRFAVNAVAEERGQPVESIRSLADVVNADGVAKCLKAHIRRQKSRGTWDPRCSSLHGIAAWMLGVAGAWCRLDEEQITRIKAMMRDRRVRTESVGRMTARRRDALKGIHHKEFVRTWVNLPEELVKECRQANNRFKTDERSRATMRAAVALAIGQILPLRLENLATFTITGRAPTLVSPRVRTGVWSVDVPASEIKNQNGANGLLDKRTSKIISDYVEYVRPHDLKQYAPNGSDCLFPGGEHSEHRKEPAMGHIGLKCVGGAIASRLRKAALGNLTSHCIRHITATLLLAWRPNLLQVVADLLGDTVETVEKHYVRGNTAAAVRMNLAMIEEHLAGAGDAVAEFEKRRKRRRRS